MGGYDIMGDFPRCEMEKIAKLCEFWFLLGSFSVLLWIPVKLMFQDTLREHIWVCFTVLIVFAGFLGPFKILSRSYTGSDTPGLRLRPSETWNSLMQEVQVL